MPELPSTETVELLGHLIAFDTVSSRSNMALIDYVAARLGSLGIVHRILPSADGKKANLWAMIGPDRPGGVVLSGHSDVVPVEGQTWDSDPFTMRCDGERLYGRGTTDMKGFIACAIAALERHREAPLERPIHLAISYDEEVGCLGAPYLIDWLTNLPIPPAIALIGEPTSMRIVNAHKSVTVARTEISGVEAHSSMAHHGVSAIDLAGRMIAGMKDMEADLADTHRDDRFLPDRATISVNRIGGGTAVNILAGQAWFDWDVRGIPDADGDTVLGRMDALQQAVAGPAARSHSGVTIGTRVLANVPALAPESEGAAETFVRALLADFSNDACAVSYGTEAGQFQRAGMSAVVIGPGSIDEAHKANEFVALSQLAACELFLDAVVVALSGQEETTLDAGHG
ncbi:acetylornithine deacetylase [Sphingobium aquiterrae]|uniref:acetylornithine deacetylase n=1 Tax=Sphingobium aquiterrae TaxID=2038656 RepID=UPI00301832AB